MTDTTIAVEPEVEVAIANATSEDNFDALAFFSGAALPEDTITVYQDIAAAYRLSALLEKQQEQAQRGENDGLSLADETDSVDENEIDALRAQLLASAVKFNLRGLAPAARDAIEKNLRAKHPYTEGAENTEYNEAFNATLIAKTIVSVTNAKGQTDKNAWDAARVLAFGKAAQPSEFEKLFLGAFRVNYVGDAIDRAVNADF